MKNKLFKLFALLTLSFVCLQPLSSSANDASNANGKYANLLQTLHCPSDSRSYGNYKDYGYWGGGAWCGQQGSAGYWVWVNPNWYVWGQKATARPSKKSAYGKYSTLLQTVNCPRDKGQYGKYRDYGYWGGGAWCGQQGRAGYWVWEYPNWYVWQYQR